MKMTNERVPGQFVAYVTAEEVIRSVGIQLAVWADAIAFTDAAFGEKWSLETADRMVCLSELLHNMHVARKAILSEWVIDLPQGMIGQVSINPRFKPRAAKPGSKNTDNADKEGGVQSSIDDLPF
jgi:hypothetical protein